MSIKGILIDPFACEVKAVEIEGDVLQAYYRLLSHETMPVDCVTAAYPGVLSGRDALFVDDEGLMKEPERFFQIATGHQPFAGKGLIVGADSGGYEADAVTSVDIVRVSTLFLAHAGVGLLPTDVPWSAPRE